jgi:hypothetical protein
MFPAFWDLGERALTAVYGRGKHRSPAPLDRRCALPPIMSEADRCTFFSAFLLRIAVLGFASWRPFQAGSCQSLPLRFELSDGALRLAHVNLRSDHG